MKYKIGDTIEVLKTNEIKTIVDCETIIGENIYYMSDITSYPEYKISKVLTEKIFFSKLEDNREKIINLIDYEKIAKNWLIWYNNH